MNAAIVRAFDAPPRYTTFVEPEARAAEVIVRVSAAGLHPIVKSLANGTHYGSTGALPFIPGVDGVGRLEDGSRVYFGISRSPFGSFAERTVAAKGMCLPLPDGLDDATAAASGNPAMSSWAALTLRAKFVSGESVLILGATGVGGKLAVQIAKRLGARQVIAAGRNPEALEELKRLGARQVIAAGRNPEALEELKGLGADAVISLGLDKAALVAAFRKEWIEAGGVDVVLDYLWGAPAESLLEAISQKGLQHSAARIRFVQIGSSAGGTITLPAAVLRSSALEMLGSGFGSASIEQIMQAVGEFFKEAAARPFEIEVERVALRDVEVLWNGGDKGARLVFQP